MLHDPIEKRLLEANVVAGLFAFDPLVPKDFLPLGEELFIEQGFFDERGIFVGGVAHMVCANFYNETFASMFLTGALHARAVTSSPSDA